MPIAEVSDKGNFHGVRSICMEHSAVFTEMCSEIVVGIENIALIEFVNIQNSPSSRIGIISVSHIVLYHSFGVGSSRFRAKPSGGLCAVLP